jgi:hypothetical protein
VEKVAQNVKKLPNENNRPIGENSPNMVTLFKFCGQMPHQLPVNGRQLLVFHVVQLFSCKKKRSRKVAAWQGTMVIVTVSGSDSRGFQSRQGIIFWVFMHF